MHIAGTSIFVFNLMLLNKICIKLIIILLGVIGYSNSYIEHFLCKLME